MNDTERLYADFLQIMNEKIKSELLNIFPETHAAAKAIQSDPYGRITSETLNIVTSTLTPLPLRRLKHEINEWIDEEFSYLDCQWDKSYAYAQKERLFRVLSGRYR
ncbi:hypothetical protein GCR96_23495 [Salmonella enterica]|uniref:Uncharacterized protein n=1 Tax=Salmonella enterica subsp. enterica serovar Miami TaxID=286780 RepID=A0A753AH62_SALET|nr:hypothetical protein [Salmonella enterica]ECS7318230.1 hypothetical protein [Salmonella enterica subsp. enterica serovar Miami str. CFSAN000579]EDV7008965.1 hypothetical protein [Salmonella enterica subsp. enterica serovar Miami]HAA1153850.1 hypothetical protein [Salmonella enterica subsp. enterica serovar Pullorum]EAP2667975.1 hypothetical protein [Salmonella enterica]EAV4450857.1 hypothetical protein [Salmonella enterica]